MNLVIGGIFGVVTILIVRQIITLRSEWLRYKKADDENEFDSNRYSDRINEIGKSAMDAIEKGMVKKQLLPNDALKHNSNKVLDEYINFVNNSSVYQYLISAKERKYNG